MTTPDVAELAQTLFEEIGDAAFVTDPETLRVVDVNPMAQRLTGFTNKELLQVSLDQLFRSEGDHGLAFLRRALHTTLTFHSQEGYFLRGKEGTWMPVNLTLTRLHTERGQLGLVLARDVTERVQIEEKLRQANATLERRVQERTDELAQVNESLRQEMAKQEQATAALRASEERFRGAFEHTGVAMALTDMDNRFVRVNAAFVRLFGFSADDMLRLTLDQLTHPNDLADSSSRRRALIRGEDRFFQTEMRHLHRDGQVIWSLTSVSLVRDQTGQPLSYIVQVQNIADRKWADQKFRSVLESAPDAMVITSPEGGIVLVNSQTEKTFGYQREELLGHPIEQLLPERYRNKYANYRKDLLGSTRSRLAVDLDLHGRRKNGSEFPIEISLSPLETEDGILTVSAIRDVTERKQMEDQFRQSQKMDAIGRLAGGVAHDFNNLLTVISGFSEILQSSLAANDPAQGLVGQIQKAGNRAAGLTRQLLAFSHQHVLERRVLQLNTIVEDISNMLRRLIGEDISLTTVLHPALEKIKADPGQLEQIIMNLAVNARDAMPRGGKLTIETANIDLDQSYVQTHREVQPGRYVMLAVSDTGSGMDQTTRARIFEPFFTTKGLGKGTGLGLATVFGIVKASGGHIWVYSEPGQGATFKIYFPAAEEGANSSSVMGKTVLPRGQETILLVEDEDAVRELAAYVLKSQGYSVIKAASGAEALHVHEKHGKHIDLLVTDVVMPAMSGRELWEALISRNPRIRVLFLSGYTDDAVVRHGILQAEVKFLQKPFTPHALAQKVREALDELATLS